MNSFRIRAPRRVSPRRLIGVAALLGAIGAFFGCANGEIRLGDPFDRKFTLEEAQHRYTVLVRFGDFQKARDFVVKADQDSFTKRMKTFRQAHFTGYESDGVDFEEGNRRATVDVVYTLYLPSNPYEIEITESQAWTRDGVGNDWRVISTFEPFDELASN
jgi:hypothetical protein